MKVTSVPWPGPPLAARMRPPWASTSPLQIARPRPAAPSAPSRSPPDRPVCLRNRCGSRSGATPRPSSATEIATWTPSRTAVTRMGEDSGACREALENRLFSTWTMRRRSAIVRGRSGGVVRRAILTPQYRATSIAYRADRRATHAPDNTRERGGRRGPPAAFHRQLQRETPTLRPRLPEPQPFRGGTAPQTGQIGRLKQSGQRSPLEIGGQC